MSAEKKRDDENELLDSSFTLEQIASKLSLTSARSKLINDLYKSKQTLEKQHDVLLRSVEKERAVNNMQQEFVSLASHEFRTPLAIIKASADIIERLKKNDENVIKQVVKIQKAVVRMGNLINSTLNLSKMETGKLHFNPEAFDLEELLLEIIERFRDVNPGAKIEVGMNFNGRKCYGDKGLIDQVFTNLISNALKYCKPDQKRVLVKAGLVEEWMIISVQDFGIGMPADELDKLFTKFHRARNAIGIAGTGIGLYLVKHLLELHSGNIKVASKEGVGTTFTVKLPCAKDR